MSFDSERLARKSDPVTSHMAAERVAEFGKGHCAIILQCLLKHGAMTVDEIAKHTNLQSQQINKRMPDLKRAGKATPTNSMRMSASGRNERVWMALR